MFFVCACKHYRYYQAIMYLEFIGILAYLFQENKSYGNKPFAFILRCYVTVCHRHVWHSNTSEELCHVSQLELCWAEYWDCFTCDLPQLRLYRANFRAFYTYVQFTAQLELYWSVCILQVQFAKNIPLDEDDQANGEKASVLVACIGVTSGLIGFLVKILTNQMAQAIEIVWDLKYAEKKVCFKYNHIWM